jgi:hypothetical protein
MTEWQFYVLLGAIILSSWFIERKLDAIQKQNATLIRKLVLRGD